MGRYMSYQDHLYHNERERHCRSMAELAADADVRRRHEELAALHASRAALFKMPAAASAG
jgi:hypothetical protein